MTHRESNPVPVNQFRKHLLLALLIGLGIRLVFVLDFPSVAGDTKIYEELARNWRDHGVYGLWIEGQLRPVDLRAPGYPAYLVAVYSLFGPSRLAVRLGQAALDLLTCLLVAGLAASLAPEAQRRRIAIAGLWLAASCPFVANYAGAPLTEVLATFLIAAALFEFVQATTRDGSPLGWFTGGLLAGLGTLVRPETPLVLGAVALVLGVRWRRKADWLKFFRAGLLMAAGLVLPLFPWAARNWHTLHRVQFLAPRYAELPEEYVPRGFYAWTNTWLVRYRDVYRVTWKLEEQPIRIEDIPASAFDSPEERARVAALLERHNQDLDITPEMDREFTALARERTTRHPLRTYLRVPLERAATLWFTPRIELLPVSGGLWPLREQLDKDPVDFSIMLGFGLLNFFYLSLAIAGAWRAARRKEQDNASRHWGVALLVVFVFVRTGFFTQMETPEPRYVLECFPAVLALGAQLWNRSAFRNSH